MTTAHQATSGTAFHSGPVTHVEDQFSLLGLVQGIPALLFAWAYGRARAEGKRRAHDPSY